ncbi:hypothetical protein AQ490_16405 [Wenjunlia vitaminophila]|uniref:GerMN domain-containing protein n=1 Tax=Wenjunlia vitaminophila TaxID=76728 RepID=A0A0T6LX38_WENVI|nr:hypothetical protein [Wenjunlia vitaminophila]KRV50634.1 hypothetical protein AQ490_16405 [Wenjunlia vitaminophila]
MSGRLTRAGVLASGLALLLCSCRIPATGVIEAGEPASGVKPRARVYFVRDGALAPAFRSAGLIGPFEPELALAVLLKGPVPAERAEGLDTALPLLPTLPELDRDDGTMWIEMPPGSPVLSELAVAQVGCTVLAAEDLTAPAGQRVDAVVVVDAEGQRAVKPKDCAAPTPGLPHPPEATAPDQRGVGSADHSGGQAGTLEEPLAATPRP